MKYIKTYEGLFDFFKKVDLDRLSKECRRILSGKKDLKEEKLMDGFEWSFSDSVNDKDLKYFIKISKRNPGVFYLHIQCESAENEEISDYISTQGIKYIMKDGKEMLEDLEFHINHNIKSLGNKVSIWMKSEEFFLDHPEDEIRDYLFDLKDTLGDDINLTKDYQKGGWNMTFHISRDSDNFDSVKGEVDEQIKLLGDLLDDVNLKLVDLEEKPRRHYYFIRLTSGQKVYGQYNFLICKK